MTAGWRLKPLIDLIVVKTSPGPARGRDEMAMPYPTDTGLAVSDFRTCAVP